MRPTPPRVIAVCGILLAVGLLLPAAADWLVMRDGSRVETDGPWRVESRLVGFKRPNGTLGSLRLSDVDLDASRELTDEMAAREAAPTKKEPEKRDRPVVARLTERELPPVRGRSAPPEGTQTAPDTAKETPKKDDNGLEVTSFRELSSPNSEGVSFRGTVQNQSKLLAVGVGVVAVVYDENGDEVRRATAVLTASALQAGQSAGFRADFPGVYQYAQVEFKVSGELLKTSGAEGNGTNAQAPPGSGP